MVDYEKEYDRFEDVPNNIDYGSWYEYDNFQDFLDGRNAMDLTEGEDIDFLLLNLPEESILDFNELRDEESIYREEYVNSLIENKINEKEGLEEYLKSLEEEEIDYEYLESRTLDSDILEINGDEIEKNILEEERIKELIEDHLLEEEELNKEFLKNKALKKEIEDQIDDMDYDESIIDFDYDGEIEEKYYEHIESLDELYYKMHESRRENNENEESFNEITDYGDNHYES